MPDATTAFLDGLAASPQPALQRLEASIGIDLDSNGSTEHWLLDIKQGNVSVSHRTRSADISVHTDRAVFNRIVTGKQNAMTAVLRGLADVEGDSKVLVSFQRVFPGPDTAESSPPKAPRRTS